MNLVSIHHNYNILTGSCKQSFVVILKLTYIRIIPLEAVSVGDVVEVQVLGVDVAKKRISLTMKIKQGQDFSEQVKEKR